GPFNWELPAVEVDYPDGSDKYRYFAYFLFNGDVVRWSAKQALHMSTPAIIFTKTWAFAQPKVEKVMKCLVGGQIDRKRTLLAKWKSEPKCKWKSVLCGCFTRLSFSFTQRILGMDT